MDLFITKDPTVLSRVTLTVQNFSISIDSVYSDENLLECALNCIDAYCAANVKTTLETWTSLRDIFANPTTTNKWQYPSELTTPTVSFTFEQYGNKHTYSIYNELCSIENIIRCMIGCSVLTTYMDSTVYDALLYWIDEHIDNEKLKEPIEDDDEE